MHVIVTGGSSGIGLEVARVYAARGATLTLVAREPEKLKRARRELLQLCPSPEQQIRTIVADVGIETKIAAAITSAEEALGPCDVLIASAGVVEPATFETLPAGSFAEQVTINLLGVANVVRAVYVGMKNRRSGRIMIVSSGAALVGLYGYTAYCASKSALTGFAEALAMEAAGSGVAICICFPPDTFTPQFEKELAKRPAEAQHLMSKARPWTAEAVARRIVHAVDRRMPKLYFGFSIAALGRFGSLIKPTLFWWYERKLAKLAKLAKPRGT